MSKKHFECKQLRTTAPTRLVLCFSFVVAVCLNILLAQVRIHVVVEFDHLVDPFLLLEIQQRNHNQGINKFKSLFGWTDIKRYNVMRLTLHNCIQLDPKGIFAYQTNTNLRVVDSTFSFNWVVVWWWFGFFVQFSQDTAATPKYSRNGACPIQEYSWKMFVLSN